MIKNINTFIAAIYNNGNSYDKLNNKELAQSNHVDSN
jgi:hypothetical protein